MLTRSQVSYPATFKRVEDLGFLFLAEKCSKLESIKLAGFSRISDASCREILHSFPNLHTFELLRSPRVTDLTFRDFSVISTKLMSVALVSCNLISNSSVKQLSYCRDLKSLNLKGCKSIGDGGLGAIATLEKLETLNLTGTDVSDMGLSTLGRGRTPLVFLSLYGCQRISDDGVACLVEGSISQTLQDLDLSNIPSLTDRAVLKLVHSGMKIVELRMRNCCNIGDTSLIALASMTCRGCGFGGSLRSLDLFNCKALTSLSIRWLRKPYFPRLRCLGLSWNILSQSVVDLLHQEHPHLRVLGYDLDFNGPDGEEIYQYSTDYGREDELERWMEGEDDY
ncbi:hypothetical protein KP509_32G043700 [Ceratopteris richardii]|nr:hypothetical protein KP509_32G043700 [Ceratopteris richardii]